MNLLHDSVLRELRIIGRLNLLVSQPFIYICVCVCVCVCVGQYTIVMVRLQHINMPPQAEGGGST
jgi:hypothetical protein